MKPPFMPVSEVGGVRYLPAAASKLPGKAKMAILMVGNQAIFDYAMMRSIALRFRDSHVAGEGSTGDIAGQHTENCIGAAHRISQMLHDVAVWELNQEGCECQCTCPCCGLGVCLCSVSPRTKMSLSHSDSLEGCLAVDGPRKPGRARPGRLRGPILEAQAARLISRRRRSMKAFSSSSTAASMGGGTYSARSCFQTVLARSSAVGPPASCQVSKLRQSEIMGS